MHNGTYASLTRESRGLHGHHLLPLSVDVTDSATRATPFFDLVNEQADNVAMTTRRRPPESLRSPWPSTQSMGSYKAYSKSDGVFSAKQGRLGARWVKEATATVRDASSPCLISSARSPAAAPGCTHSHS